MGAITPSTAAGAIRDNPTDDDSVGRSNRTRNELDLLRWGGLSGLVGGAIFVISIGYQVGVLGTQTTATGDGPIIRFPSVQMQIAVGQTLFLVATILLVPLLLTLYRSLRGPSLPAALYGTGLALLGVAVLAVESEPNVAMASISAQYHAVGATPAQQAAAVIAWQATQGMFNEFDTCAYAFLSVGLILLGIGMWKAPSFGRTSGAVSTATGVVGILGLVMFSVTSAAFAIPGLLTFVLFPLFLGWRLYRLSIPGPVGARPESA